jgi:hypothetical protein
MKHILLLASALLLAATPALATGGFDCRTTDGSNIRLSGTIGHTIVSPLVGARLQLGDRVLATTDSNPEIAIGRSWIGDNEIRVDLVDANVTRIEVRLRAEYMAGAFAVGTLVRDGVSHPVRCEVQ